MEEKVVIRYKNKSYIIIKKDLESYDQFYHRAWLIAKDEPDTSLDYAKSILKSQQKINEIYLGYIY